MKITNVTVPDKSQFEGLKLLAASSATIDAVFVTREGNEAFLARHADAAVVIEFKR